MVTLVGVLTFKRSFEICGCPNSKGDAIEARLRFIRIPSST
jgi:hypothetical protein